MVTPSLSWTVCSSAWTSSKTTYLSWLEQLSSQKWSWAMETFFGQLSYCLWGVRGLLHSSHSSLLEGLWERNQLVDITLCSDSCKQESGELQLVLLEIAQGDPSLSCTWHLFLLGLQHFYTAMSFDIKHIQVYRLHYSGVQSFSGCSLACVLFPYVCVCCLAMVDKAPYLPSPLKCHCLDTSCMMWRCKWKQMQWKKEWEHLTL